MSNPFATPGDGAPAAEDTPRSGCLSVYLVIILIANPLVALINLGLAAAGGAGVAPAPAFAALGLLGLVNTGAAVAIWMRMKVGLYLFLGSAAVGLVINLALGQFQGLAGAIIGPAILWGLVSQEWHTYR